MTKFCRNCITEIPKDSKRCPNCGKNPHKQSKTLEYIMASILLLIVIVFGGGLYYFISGDVNFSSSGNKNNNNSGDLEVKAEKSSFLKGEKKTTCTKEESDEDYSNLSKYIIISKKDKVQKFTFEETYKYNDPIAFSFAFAFTEQFYDAFDELEGFEADIKTTDTNTYSAIINIDYEKVNFEKLIEMFEVDETEDLGLYKEDITLDEFKKDLEGYTCK